MKKRKSLLWKFVLVIMVLALGYQQAAYSQGITTASFSGYVYDMKSDPLPGATVIALHNPSGTRYGTTTRADGGFNIPNVKTGGPYTVTVSYIGYNSDKSENITLSLGQNMDLMFILIEGNETLKEVVITAKADKVFNSSRTGAATNISNEQMQLMPTISRSLTDFTRLTPQAINTSGGTSFTGTNNRYNNFSIDGTVNNDVFGLAGSGTNGGQTGTQPISLDAIQEIQVVVAPYDVRQGGFTGGGINAITKSGTNEFKGTAFYYMNNQNFVGMTPISDEDLAKKQLVDPTYKRTKLDEYADNQMGVGIGGPIIKDKLFFYLNGEMTKKTTPSLNNVGDGSAIHDTLAAKIANKLVELFGDDLGGYSKFNNEANTTKLFARIDYNLNNSNKLTIRHNFVDASSDILPRTRDLLVFNKGGYTMLSKTNTSVLELQTMVTNKFSNELRVGWTTVRDKRDPMSSNVPYIRIEGFGAGYATNVAVEVGAERYSSANSLDQDILTVSDNFAIYKGKHVFTIGTHNEVYRFKNVFIRDNTGSYIYRTSGTTLGLTKFLSIGTTNPTTGLSTEILPSEYNYSYSNVEGAPKWGPEFNAAQFGLYVQDEYTFSPKFKLTYGLRVDVPVFIDSPSANEAFNADTLYAKWDVATNKMPDPQFLYSPRVGFNWNPKGDRSIQIRGGAGIFTGRVPFVWLSNQFSNTGVEYSRIRITSFSGIPSFYFQKDATKQWTIDDLNDIKLAGTTPFAKATSEIDVTDPNFKYPQTFRANAAVDKKLPFGITATLEGIFSKKLNDILYQNLNLKDSGKALETADTRPIWPTSPNLSAKYTSVIYLTNTSEGYSYSATAMLAKEFKFGLNIMAGYTYGMSRDVNAGTSSQAYSNWSYNEQYNGPNTPETSFSDFDYRHRIIGLITFKKEYMRNFGTSVGLFYNGQTGTNFSYIYNGDLNRDGVNGNDLIFVPADASQINLVDYTVPATATSAAYTVTAAEQWANLDAFISGNKYLNSVRGKYAERNAATTPFIHMIDFRIAQDFYLKVKEKRNTLQVTFDMFNVANLINKDWGRVYSVSYNYKLIDFVGYDTSGNATTNPNYNKPKYNFKAFDGDPWAVSDLTSRWRGQIGIRYIFG